MYQKSIQVDKAWLYR